MDNFMERLQKAMNENDTKAMNNEKLQTMFDLGVAAGVQQMQNKIREHCKNGKPLLIGDDLYFIQDSRQHLIEVMDSIDKEYGI